MSVMDLLIAAGIATAATGGVGKHHASKNGSQVSFKQAIPLGAKVMAAPLVEKAKTSANQAREQRRIRKEMAAQGFAPFGKPADRMPPSSYKNPSGLEGYATARPTVRERLRDAFSVKRFTRPSDDQNPGDAQDASDGPTSGEQKQPVTLTPGQEQIVQERINERIRREAPDEDDAGADARVVVINQIVLEEYRRAAQEFSPTTTDSTDSEGKPMSAVPMYTSYLELFQDQHESRKILNGKIADIETDKTIPVREQRKQINELMVTFNSYWDERLGELDAYLASPQAQGHCPSCGHDLQAPDPACKYRCINCRCRESFQAASPAAAPAANPSGPAPEGMAAVSAPDVAAVPANEATSPGVPPEVVTAPMDYLEAVVQFAAAGMTRMSIPQIITYLTTAGEAFGQLSGVLRQLAARLDEEAMFDDKVLENIRAAATMAQLAGIKFTTASQVTGTLYRQWIEASQNGARVPSQGVLAASNS